MQANFLGEINGYGNAVISQIPEMIGYAILEAIQQEATHTEGQKLPEPCYETSNF